MIKKLLPVTMIALVLVMLFAGMVFTDSLSVYVTGLATHQRM